MEASLILSLLSVMAALFTTFILIMEKKRQNMPPISYQITHSSDSDENHLEIVIFLGRLEHQPYSVFKLRTIGTTKPKILCINKVEADSGQLLLQPIYNNHHHLNLAIDVMPDFLINTSMKNKPGCIIGCTIEKSEKPTYLQICFKTAYWPRKSWYDIPIASTPTIYL